VSAFRRDFSRFSASSSFFSVLPSRLSDFAASSPNFSRPFEDQDRFARTVLTVRCGLDCLSFRPDIDICRGAIVGFSFGARIGATVSAVDARPRSAVLIASVPRMSEFWRASGHPDVVQVRHGFPPGIMDRYAQASKPFDASESLQRCTDIHSAFPVRHQG
jgi:hypothetical protein